MGLWCDRVSLYVGLSLVVISESFDNCYETSYENELTKGEWY
jgi:hypothetical protein